MELAKELIDKVEELGWEPYEAPEPLDPIEEDEVQLVCWLAVAPER